jgi:LysM repeat protein
MPTEQQKGPGHRTEEEASNGYELVDVYRDFPNRKAGEGRGPYNHATLSVWAVAVILCSILLFGLHQARSRLQGIQGALQQLVRDNKLLLEGLDEMLVRTDQPPRYAKAESAPPETAEEKLPGKADSNEADNLAKRYKIYYRTKDGEDLRQISEKFGVSEDQLRLWNALRAADAPIPGQVLVINKSTEPDKPVEAPPVSPGPKLADRRKPAAEETPPQRLAHAEPVQSDEERDEPPLGEEKRSAGPGPAAREEDFRAVGKEAPTTDAPRPVSAQRADEMVHTVRQGESLSEIGEMYGVSWQALAKLNGIEAPGRIFKGQRLSIPMVSEKEETTLPTRVTTHRVLEGDNLYRIGLAYGLTWEQIARANGINDPANIHVGQILKIPLARGGPEER